MSHQFDGIMATCAVNYCIGRRTYITSTCADWLIAIWGQLPASAQAIIKRDVERAFAKDDAIRASVGNDAMDYQLPLGADCDREQWERVRKLWQ